MTMSLLTYQDSGVHIVRGNVFIDQIKPLIAATNNPGVCGGIGGFAGLFDLKYLNMKDPLLVAATDGVGTKLKLAVELEKHDTIGIDLVAMCVNDLIVQGAQPLFFLDYFATSVLDIRIAREVILGIVEGCKQSQCALIGGETAEMPGMYAAKDYDIAGFAVGAVEREHVLPKKQLMQEGDYVLGLPSSGVHANGYSLVRYLMKKKGYFFRDKAVFNPSQTYGDIFLMPTKIYVEECLKVVPHVKGLAHITGGGLLENIPRILPDELAVELKYNIDNFPLVFQWLQSEGNIAFMEMCRTFNCGIGMVIIASENNIALLESILPDMFVLGAVVKRGDRQQVNFI